MSLRRFWGVSLAVVLAVATARWGADESPAVDAGVDASTPLPDAGERDAGPVAVDAGVDASTPVPDAGGPDGGVDAGPAADAGPNRAPTLSAITAPGTLVAGKLATLAVTATDLDGDPLTYSWAQNVPAAQGTWVGPKNGSSAQWFSPVLSAQTGFTFSVSVTDGRSAPVVQTVSFPVTVPTFAADVQPILESCTFCHGPAAGLDLSEGASYDELVSVPAETSCTTLNRVTPGDPDDSVLIRKMEGTTCGTRMPQGSSAYFTNNPQLVVLVRSWILKGADEN